MHAIAKCCGYYCACIMATGMVFFAVLAIMQLNKNTYLTRFYPEETDSRVTALVLAIALNGICFINCVSCIYYGSKKEAEEEERTNKAELRRLENGGEEEIY